MYIHTRDYTRELMVYGFGSAPSIQGPLLGEHPNADYSEYVFGTTGVPDFDPSEPSIEAYDQLIHQ